MNFDPFKYERTSEFLYNMMNRLPQESYRGAIIIGIAALEAELTLFLEEFMPLESKNKKNQILKYPGYLSSFGSKITLSYAFRLINEQLYTCLDKLKSLRNDAAHQFDFHSTEEFRSRIREAFSITPAFAELISDAAIRSMMDIKIESFKDSLLKQGIEFDHDRMLNLLQKPETKESLESQIPNWELIYGTSIICGYLLMHKEHAIRSKSKFSTWMSITLGEEE